MPLTVRIEPERVIEKTADDRGRVTLGSEYANQDVKILIVTDPDPGSDNGEDGT